MFNLIRKKTVNTKLGKPLVLIALFITVITLFTYTPPPTHAQSGSGFTLQAHFGGGTDAVFIDGNTAYVGIGNSLAVVDVSTPTNPTLIGKSDPSLPEVPQYIQVVDTIAYMAGWRGDLMIVDVSNPANPVFLDIVHSVRDVTDITVVGNTMYIAADIHGLTIFDVSDPANPAFLSFVQGGSEKVEVVENIAYIAYRGLKTIDVSDPANPIELASARPEHGLIMARDVAVHGNIAYTANHDDGVMIYDISDPASPVILGMVDTWWNDGGHTQVETVMVVENIMYVVDEYQGLVVMDVSDPTNPTPLSLFDETTAFGFGIAVNENTVYMAVRDSLSIVDVSNPANPVQLTSFEPILSSVIDMFVQGDIAYVASGGNKLEIIDVSNPAPVLLGVHKMVGKVSDVTMVGNTAYITHIIGNTGNNDTLVLEAVDVSDPANPVFLNSVELLGESGDIHVVGNTIYLIHYHSGSLNLMVYDVSDPTNLMLLTSLPFGYATGISGNLVVIENIGYMMVNGSLRMLDVSNPANPVFFGMTDESISGGRIDVVDNTAYITDRLGLETIDVSDPTNPILLDKINTGYPLDVKVKDNIAYVTDRSNGLVAIDVSDPTNLGHLDSVEVNGSTIEIVGDMIYVFDHWWGLYVFEYMPPSNVSVAPCPESGAWPAGCNPNLPPDSPPNPPSPSSPPDDGDTDCEIPPSGPWPPCATGGGVSTPPPSDAESDCIIPPFGPWPPCATGGGGATSSPSPPDYEEDCVIPPSGPWPECATGG